ncbi:MAG: hypothetical protein ACKOEO_17355, partial [Planctomycetaceae bacterium]
MERRGMASLVCGSRGGDGSGVWDGETARGQANWDISFPSYRQSPPERITKNVPGRAVDVNRPVTLW